VRELDLIVQELFVTDALPRHAPLDAEDRADPIDRHVASEPPQLRVMTDPVPAALLDARGSRRTGAAWLPGSM